MSQICRFYLKGTCKYGDSCHFIHENNYYSRNNKDYSEHSYGYQRNNYNENYSHKNRDSYNSYETTQNFNKNFNRYHVDHRQQSQPTEIKLENLTLPQFVDLIKTEVKQFEDRHVWKLSVISPVKPFGNIPGFQDYSPEEIRYQFYMASSNNTLHEFKGTMDKLREDLIRNYQQMTNNSSVYNIAKQMMSNGNSIEDTVSFQTPQQPSSSFTFDLNALPKQNAEFPQQQSFPQSNAFNSFSFAQPPASNATNEVPVNWVNRQSFPNEPTQATQMNAFSFSSQNETPAPASSLFSGTSQTQTPVPENNPCYSKIEELPPEQLQAFRAPTFRHGYIPLQPPTKELCTKY